MVRNIYNIDFHLKFLKLKLLFYNLFFYIKYIFNICNMRKERIKHIRNTINKEWSNHYFKFILDNPDKDWNWGYISYNPNITMDIIREHPDKSWDWDWISMNKFTKEKEQFVNRKYREYMASYKIQQWCLSILMSPHYKIGRTLIDKKYKELFDS